MSGDPAATVPSDPVDMARTALKLKLVRERKREEARFLIKAIIYISSKPKATELGMDHDARLRYSLGARNASGVPGPESSTRTL
jgi:hypothetical protein